LEIVDTIATMWGDLTEDFTFMDRKKFTETMLAFRRRTPFKPFTVAMVNGNRYEVDFPDALAIREGVAIFAGPGGVPVFFDHESVSEVIGDVMGTGAGDS
jgi:hypothetical protein